jgi:hypothetical protein
MKALQRHIFEKVRTGKANLVKEAAAKATFENAITARINKLIEEKKQTLKENGYLWDYVDGFNRATNESFLDGLKAVGSAAGSAAAGAVSDGTGINLKKLAKVVRAFQKPKAKANFSVSKVPSRRKARPKLVVSNEPIKMSRQDFAKHLRSSGNQLHKIKNLS